MEPIQFANPRGSRIDQIDVLRGFALLGIGIENIFAIHTPNNAFAEYALQFPEGLNHWVLTILMIAVRGKFYPIFSLVFGMAAAYSLPKDGPLYFLRRLGGLLSLGILQVFFIWNGDVLVQYAAMGGLLLLCRFLSSRVMFPLSFLLLLVSFCGDLFFPAGVMQNVLPSDPYATGSFIEVTRFRIQEYGQAFFSWSALLFYAKIFSFMLLGFALVKGNVMQKMLQRQQATKAIAFHALLVAGVGVFFVLAGWRDEQNAVLWIRVMLLAVFYYALVACYSLLPFVFRKHFLSLKWMGRLTLSHYIIQNLIFSLMMYGYGLGLYQTLQPWQLVATYLVVVFVQFALSQKYLSSHRLGPLEAVLRKVAGKP